MTDNNQTQLEAPAARFGWLDIVLLGVLLVAMLAPRLVALGRFVTADEPTWGKRSANFYYALDNGDWASTYQTGHPGVLTMWAGALAYHLKFPQYLKFGQAELGDTKLLQIFQRHGPNPLELMVAARLNVVIANVIALAASFLFARRLFGRWLSFFAFLLIAFLPMHVAHSRFLHTNGMLSSYMFLAVLGYLYYLQFRGWLPLVVSGAAAGLSYLTITPSFNLVPVVFLLTLLSLLHAGPEYRQWRLKAWAQRLMVPLVLWGLVSLLTVFIVWPSMWVQPLESLLNILRYTVSVTEGNVVGVRLPDAQETLNAVWYQYLHYYPLTYLWRATPVTLIGLILAIPLLLRRSAAYRLVSGARWNLILLLAYVGVYTVTMTIGAKKGDRYFLPAYLPLSLVAAAGWYALANWLAARFEFIRKYSLQYVMLGSLVLIEVLGTMRTAPYYLTYYNPLLGGISKAPGMMSIGWGEGLNEAALYLEEKTDFCDQRIISWYTLAYNWYSTSFGCQAQSVEFSSDKSLEYYLDNFDYAIIYINQRQRNYPEDLLQYLEEQTPEHTIWIDGVDYARIYRLKPASPDTSQ